MKNKLLIALMSVVMVVTMMPLSVFAQTGAVDADGSPTQELKHAKWSVGDTWQDDDKLKAGESQILKTDAEGFQLRAYGAAYIFDINPAIIYNKGNSTGTDEPESCYKLKIPEGVEVKQVSIHAEANSGEGTVNFGKTPKGSEYGTLNVGDEEAETYAQDIDELDGNCLYINMSTYSVDRGIAIDEFDVSYTGEPTVTTEHEISKRTSTGVEAISAKVGQTEVETAEKDAEVSVFALPEIKTHGRYDIKNIVVTPDDGSEPTIIAGNSGTFKMPDCNVAITEEVNDVYNINKEITTGVSNISTKVEGDNVTEAAEGTQVSVAAQPKSGYIIQNITITPEDGSTPITITGASGTFEMPKDNVTVEATAVEEPETEHTVTFDPNNEEDKWEVTVEDGETVAKPDPDPTKLGHEFLGWAIRGEQDLFDFNTPIKSDITLIARYKINSEKVNFKIDSRGTGTGGFYYEDEKVESINVPWGSLFDFEKKSDQLVIIHFYNYGPISVKADEGSVIQGLSASTMIITEDCDFLACFTKQYSIDKNTTVGVSKITTQVDGQDVDKEIAGQTVCVSALADSGYEIERITITDASGKEVKTILGDQGEFTMPESDVTVTATAIDPTREYKVTFDSQGGTEVPAQMVSAGGYATEPENPTKTGYVFNGWFVTPQAAGTAFDFDKTPITADITLYADWIKIPVVPQVTGLNAKATDSKTALATWNKVTGLDGVKYEVWRSAGTSGQFKKVATTASNSYKDTKVITGTKYTYKVRAICEGQTGEFSDTDYAYPRLFQVTNFSAKALNAAKAQISWNANGNKNVVYQVYRSTQSNTGFKRVETITDGKTTYSQTFTPAQSGMKYYYKVRAITKDYTGKWHYGTFSKVDYAYPRVATPTGFKAWASDKHTCNCSWNKVAGSNVKYLVYRGTNPTGNWGNAIATTTKTSYTNKNMKSGKKYYYMVRAVQTIKGKNYYSDYSTKDYAYPR